MTRTELIDHLKAGWPVTKTIVKEVVAALEFSRRQNAELKRLLAMQSDLDLQGYEHMRDELQELRGKLAESDRRVKALEEAGFGVDRRIGSACIKALEAACQK